jgi:hypothetical protein
MQHGFGTAYRAQVFDCPDNQSAGNTASAGGRFDKHAPNIAVLPKRWHRNVGVGKLPQLAGDGANHLPIKLREKRGHLEALTVIADEVSDRRVRVRPNIVSVNAVAFPEGAIMTRRSSSS